MREHSATLFLSQGRRIERQRREAVTGLPVALPSRGRDDVRAIFSESAKEKVTSTSVYIGYPM